MDTNQNLTISEVAELTGLSAHALRFYEREGLLLSDKVMRGSRGHRRYSPSDLEWLDICIKLRSSGMPLIQIKRFAELVRQGAGNEQERLKILQEHQQRIVHTMEQLSDCLELINWKVGIYEEHLKQGTAQHLWTAGQ